MVSLKRQLLMILVSISLAQVSLTANVMRYEADLARIYLYTTLVFMHQMEKTPTPSAAVLVWRKAFSQLNLDITKFSDYQGANADVEAILLGYFTNQQRQYLLKEQILSAKGASAQLFLYELSYLEHPLGGYQYFSHLTNEEERLSYIFGSKLYAKQLIGANSPMYRHLSLWSLVMDENRESFNQLFDLHIEQFNADLQKR